jgi:hypothetical protein
MTGVAPEPAPLAIARVLAGGLAARRINDQADATARLATDLASLLQRAFEIGACVVPYSDDEGTVYAVEGPTALIVEWDPAANRWNART